MTRTELAIKTTLSFIVLILVSLGLTAILGNVSLELVSLPKNQTGQVSAEAYREGNENGAKGLLIAPIPLIDQNSQIKLVSISIPSGVVFENADREMIANSNESFRGLMIHIPAHYLEGSDEWVNKMFQKENLPLPGYTKLMAVSKADEEINTLFIFGNAKIMADQQTYSSADKSMILLFECSNQRRLNKVTPLLALKADGEIDRNFKEHIHANSGKAKVVQTTIAKA